MKRAAPMREDWQLLAIIVTSPITIPLGLAWERIRTLGRVAAARRKERSP